MQGQTSAIHSLASVAAAQTPLTIPNTSLAPGPNSAPGHQNDSAAATTVNINTVNVPRTTLVMQSKPPDIRMVAQTQAQTVIPSSQQPAVHVSTVKVPNANPASTNVITLGNKPVNPQTVTVVRPNADIATSAGTNCQQTWDNFGSTENSSSKDYYYSN